MVKEKEKNTNKKEEKCSFSSINMTKSTWRQKVLLAGRYTTMSKYIKQMLMALH